MTTYEDRCFHFEFSAARDFYAELEDVVYFDDVTVIEMGFWDIGRECEANVIPASAFVVFYIKFIPLFADNLKRREKRIDDIL